MIVSENKKIKLTGYELRTIFINNGTPSRKYLAKRFHLKNISKVQKLMQRVISLVFSRNKNNPNKLVKKCVRIDAALFQALRREVGSNENYISKTVSNAVLTRIKTRIIDVIETRNFNHRITVRFTQDQYKLVKQVVDELKEQGLARATFSLLVRSILYKQFKIVTDIENTVNSNVA